MRPALAVAACARPGSPDAGDAPSLASAAPAGGAPGISSFAQNVRAEDLLGELFPGQANSWVVDRDFSLAPGFGLEYGYALQLWAGCTTAPASGDPAILFDRLLDDWLASASTTALLHPFPYDQGAAEVTFLTPLLGTADGLVTAVVAAPIAGGSESALQGHASAFLAGTVDSRLVRTLALTAGTTYSLSWIEEVSPAAGRLVGDAVAPWGPRWQVVLRDPSTGAALGDPLFVRTAETFEPSAPHTASFSTSGLPAHAVDLSFELRSAASLDALGTYAAVDAVTLATTGGPVPLPNGDFEAGLAPWRAGGGGQSQNVRSAPRVLALYPAGAVTVAVTRIFYAPPAASWARLVDVFRNDLDVEVATTVVYATSHLGGSTTAWTSAAGGSALVGRDTAGGVRDVGIVFGSATGLVDPLGVVPDLAFVVHRVRLPPRGAAALVHFVVQVGEGATMTGADHATTATDAACEAIATGFRTQPSYREWLEPGVASLVQNL
ncbi:MAG TPA: hypothetical protein VF875_15215 [Anaeromyxobacter sp.]